METCRFILFLVISVALVGQVHTQPSFTYPNAPSTTAPGLQLDATGRVFVSAGNILFRLSPDLVQEESISLSADIVDRGIALSGDGSKVVVCLTDLSCSVYNATDLAAGPVFGTFNNTISSQDPVTLFTGGDTFYVGSIGSVGLGTIQLGQYGFGADVFARSTPYAITTTQFERNFGGGFMRGGYAYYFVTDNNPNDLREFRVMRVCHATECPSGNSCSIQALYETSFFCATPSVAANARICDVSLMNNMVPNSGPTVVITRCEMGASRNYICYVDLDVIDSKMDAKYDSCSTRSPSESFDVAWISANKFCNSFTATSRCELSDPLDDIDSPSIPSSADSISLSRSFTTATVAVTVESFSFLFVGHGLTPEAYTVSGFDVGNNQGALMAANSFSEFSVDAEVQSLSWQPELELIFASTRNRVYQFPIEECSSRTDCASCTADPNPLCGWCVVENKCSRQSQCQNVNDNATVRWTQNSAECLVATVTPNQFVLDTPELVNVSVNSPGLPVPLPNETFSCHLADSEGRFTITVPAVENSPQTNYTCDIRGMVPVYQGVTAVINLSFVSSLFGIPFDTTNDALRIYSCNGTTSCSECLQDNSPCGWCNYNKVCSGTEAPCQNATTFLQLSGNTFNDVCPLLYNSSSGGYIQPVRVGQDIQLQTRNLPPPVGNFQYKCMVNEVLLDAVYENETSITCTVSNGQLVLDDGVDSLPVDVSVMWTGNGINHPIDALVQQTNVTLYDCQDLATGCSSCVGSNLGTGFMCGWCVMSGSCEVQAECSNNPFITIGDNCPVPVITSIFPTTGPVAGGTTITVTGTNLGVTFNDVNTSQLLLGATPCTPINQNYISGSQFVCETTNFISPGDRTLVLNIGSRNSTSDAPPFQALEPTVTEIAPNIGPVAGGTMVTVRGVDLDIGNQADTVVYLDGQTLNCAIVPGSIQNEEIRCMTFAGVQPLPSIGVVVIAIDDARVSNQSVTFTYRNNPNVTSVSPQNTIPSGGIELRFSGADMDVVQTPVLEITLSDGSTAMSNCVPLSNVTISCFTPDFSPSVSIASYSLILDGAPPPDYTQSQLLLSVRPDPGNFVLQTTSVDAGSATIIRISGSNLDSVPPNEITVTVGGEACNITSAPSANELLCTAPLNPPNGQTEAQVRVIIGANINTLLDARLLYDRLPLEIIIPVVVVGVLLIILLLLFIMCCIICGYKSKHKKTEQRWTNLLAQMELLEVEMADECKRAFTELQTDLADLVQISDKNLPYRDFRTFAMRFLFPQDGDNHPVLHALQLPEKCDHDVVMAQLDSFFHLMKEKKFLLIFIRTLESQGHGFTLNDKCVVASLLMVCFQNDLDYSTEILQTLLAELMRKAMAKSAHPKLLLRRTESIAEKMLANWLAFLLFPYILEHVGEKLFILFRAIKSQLEKGPVDVITGEAKNSLSEEKLLRHHREVKLVEGVVVAESGEEFPIRLLDCDSITQAKEKVLDVLYKNTPVSKRPQLTKIDLELISRGTAGIPLRDQDATNTKDGEWIKVNTLGHYKLDDMSKAHIDNPKNPVPKFRITERLERPLSGVSFDTLGTTIANMNANRQSMILPGDGPNVYHLVKPEQDDSGDGEGQRGQKIVSEVFLTRLLSTKRILQSYVDDLFEAIFAVPHGRPLPKAIKSLFDFLDLQASELGIHDPEILHTWKTNSVPLRFWVNVIKNPDFLFDVNKSATVDSCLTVIAQAYIDACSTTEFKYTKDTPAARLLYVHDVKKYKTEVLQYYSTVQSLPTVSQHEMCEYLRETAQVCVQSVEQYAPETANENPDPASMKRQLYFVTESALYELFKFAAKFADDITDGLNEEGLTIQAATFDQIRKSMRSAI